MDVLMDYAGVRERLGMPKTPKPRVRWDLIKPRVDPPPQVVAPVVVPTAELPDLPYYAPFNFLKLPSPEAVIHLVALKHGLRYYDILGTSRARLIVAAKREAVWLVATHCRPMSLVQIGRLFHKNHATIINLLGRRKRSAQTSTLAGTPGQAGGQKRLMLRAQKHGALSETAHSISEAVS
jgi:hypothetical protein